MRTPCRLTVIGSRTSLRRSRAVRRTRRSPTSCRVRMRRRPRARIPNAPSGTVPFPPSGRASSRSRRPPPGGTTSWRIPSTKTSSTARTWNGPTAARASAAATSLRRASNIRTTTRRRSWHGGSTAKATPRRRSSAITCRACCASWAGRVRRSCGTARISAAHGRSRCARSARPCTVGSSSASPRGGGYATQRPDVRRAPSPRTRGRRRTLSRTH